MNIVNEDAKRVLIDKETELEGIQDCTPLAKVKIHADIAQLQQIWAWLSTFRGYFGSEKGALVIPPQLIVGGKG